MNDGPMPPDPFSAPQEDWSQMAAGLYGFFAALAATGFSEGQALHLTGVLLTTMLAGAAQQQAG